MVSDSGEANSASCSNADERENEKLQQMLDEISPKTRDAKFMKQLDENVDEQQQFLEIYGRRIGKKPPPDEANVLHLMAKSNHPCSWLVRYMIENHPDRMKDQDDAKRYPLNVAFQLRRQMFIEAVLRSKYNDADLGEILAVSKTDEGNCIHIAIENSFDPKLIIQLIHKVSGEVLTMKDSSGRTPLHCAVEYKRCTEEQLGVVKALLKQGGSALDARTNKDLSVYEHHLSTRGESGKTKAETGNGASGMLKERQRQGGDIVIISEHPGDEKNPMDGKDKKATDKKVKEEKQAREKVDIQTKDPKKMGCASTIEMGGGDEHSSVQAGATCTSTTASGPTQTSTRAQSRPGTGGATGTSTKATEDSADRIANEVKLEYLRTTFVCKQRDHNSALNFLYGSKQAKYISLNLLHKDKFIGENCLTKGGYSQFDFDQALQVVAIGSVTFGIQTDTDEEMGRSDMVTLFKWLHNEKGVRNIIKVIVSDHELPSHTDAAIIEALKPFVVEILDWSKPDLCPETIREACGNVRELHLAWTGTDGILLAWGGQDGLARLPQLTSVHLRQIKHAEPDDWTEQKLEQFKNNLKESRERLSADRQQRGESSLPIIQVHRSEQRQEPKKVSTAPASPETREEPVFKEHQWLEITDKFSEDIYNLLYSLRVNDYPMMPEALQRNVRICLIDDGVDFNHKSITNSMEYGMSFGYCRGEQYRNIIQAHYHSTTNHGTLMASMMARVCACVKISSYRLDTVVGERNKVLFTAKSAADALEHAARQDFDIISMSWTVKRDDSGDTNNKKDIDRLTKALSNAAETKLVFCSAPDLGDINADQLKLYYPVGSTDEAKIFRIGAAKSNYRQWSQVGPKSSVNYILPGHEVREKQGEEVSQTNSSPKTGSSIATALAAGLAALTMQLVRMAAVRTFQEGKQNEANAITAKSLGDIKKFDNMKAVLDKMIDRQSGENYRYLHVDKMFGETRKNQSAATEVAGGGDTDARKWRTILELARELRA